MTQTKKKQTKKSKGVDKIKQRKLRKYFGEVSPEELIRIQRDDTTKRHIEKSKYNLEKTNIYFRVCRKREGIKRCRDCGKRLKNENHHKLCDTCWEIQQIKNRA